jgi:protein arginine kinase
MKDKKADLPPTILEHTPWENEEGSIWPASVFILRRNLSRENFPPKLEEQQAARVLETLKNALFASAELAQPLLFTADELPHLDKEFLFEHFLRLESFPAGSKNQAFVLDGSGKFLSLFNVQDHLQLQLIDCKGEWEKAWNLLNTLEGTVAAKLEFAYSPKFGYLTADPNLCGTALEVLVYLHLPALIHTGQLQEALVKQKEEDIVATTMQGNLEEIVGDMIILKNRYTLGLAEEAILHSLHVNAMKFVAFEKSVRTHLQKENTISLKDEISRAYGLLLHSYQLQTKEALGALSLLKLGLDLGWVANISHNKLNDTFFKCRHGHLSKLFPESQDPVELAHRRAEFLHKQLAGTELKI